MASLIRSFNILVVCANPLPGSFASFFMIGKDWGDGVCVYKCAQARVRACVCHARAHACVWCVVLLLLSTCVGRKRGRARERTAHAHIAHSVCVCVCHRVTKQRSKRKKMRNA